MTLLRRIDGCQRSAQTALLLSQVLIIITWDTTGGVRGLETVPSIVS